MLMVNGLTPSEIASRGFPVLDLYLAQLADQHKKLVRMVTAIKVEGGGFVILIKNIPLRLNFMISEMKLN